MKYSDDEHDKSPYREDFTSGIPSHKSDRRINNAGRAASMAAQAVSQKVKEKELETREKDLDLNTAKSLMTISMAKAQADSSSDVLFGIARQLEFKQAMLDGKLDANNVQQQMASQDALGALLQGPQQGMPMQGGPQQIPMDPQQSAGMGMGQPPVPAQIPSPGPVPLDGTAPTVM